MKKLSRTVFTLAGLLAMQAHAAQHNIDVQLNVDMQENGNVLATLSLTNNGKGNEKILGWYTDLEEEAIFNITRDGEKVAFNGPHYKRPAPAEKDYIKLKKGQTITKKFELSSLYDFSAPGNYEVSYNVVSLDLFSNQSINSNKRELQNLSSNSVSFWGEGLAKGTANKGKPGSGTSDCSSGTCFTGRCSNSEQSAILSALAAADQIANDAVSYLSSHSASNPSTRYQTWFGQATTARYNIATGHFDAINDAIDNKPLTFDCSCSKSYFAYVYPNQPYKVYLCNAFWSANELGTDSRAGTIVHELSHFTAVAGTDDIVYGQSGAKSLAISNPDQALNNADSHEYFAENTPRQN